MTKMSFSFFPFFFFAGGSVDFFRSRFALYLNRLMHASPPKGLSGFCRRLSSSTSNHFSRSGFFYSLINHALKLFSDRAFSSFLDFVHIMPSLVLNLFVFG